MTYQRAAPPAPASAAQIKGPDIQSGAAPPPLNADALKDRLPARKTDGSAVEESLDYRECTKATCRAGANIHRVTGCGINPAFKSA